MLSPGQLSAMNAQIAISPKGYVNWFRIRGGVQALEGRITVTIASNSAAAVTVKELDVVKNCHNPLHGTLFSNTLGAGPQFQPQIDFNLDQLLSVGQYGPPSFGKHPTAGGNFFAKEDLTLSPHERPQTLTIYVTTSRYCTFSFQMHVVTAKGVYTEKINDGGRPFQLTGVPNQADFTAIYDTSSASQGALQFVQVKPK